MPPLLMDAGMRIVAPISADLIKIANNRGPVALSHDRHRPS